MPGAFQIGDRRAIGCGFLGALIGKHRAARRFHAANRDACAGLCQPVGACHRAGRGRARTQKGSDDSHGLGARKLFAQALLVAAGDVTGFVRQHADDLVRRFRHQQRAGVDEDAAAGDEGVKGGIVDQNDLDTRFSKAGRLKDGPDVIGDKRLDLGVADHRYAALGGCR